MKFVKNILIFCITGLRPMLGPSHCKYQVTCTHYAIQTLQSENFFNAFYIILGRVISCISLF